MIRRHIIFYGRVQGVGFRFYSVSKARQLGMTGWVKNRYDGSVEMEAQGEDGQFQELIAFLKRQRYIDIADMDVEEIPLKEEREFQERF